ncbi:MAG: hypothetical protein WCT17_01700 [Bacilli bacterium]
MEDHRLILEQFQSILKKERTTLFKNDFQYQMTQESCDTLLNMRKLIAGYEHLYTEPLKEGSKVLLLFGLLQGLFVAIDCLYTIGRSTSLDKMMININQNSALREIKYIRNDVVGHPSYRYYDDNVVGFCELDIENLVDDVFVYRSVVYVNDVIQETTHRVKMLDVIQQYYQESTDVLTQTIQFFNMKHNRVEFHLSEKVSQLADDFMEGQKNNELLQSIDDYFTKGFYLAKDSHHRVLWRTRLIRYLFNQAKNAYIDYLTILEMYKLYCLLYQLEKQINPTCQFQFVRFTPNPEFVLLKNLIKKTKNKQYDPSFLHDNAHPLHQRNFEILLKQYENHTATANLRQWIQDKLLENNRDMMYLIGSELKI